MMRGKVASNGLLLLAGGVLSLGCTQAIVQDPQPQAAPPRPRSAEVAPAPPLRITEPATSLMVAAAPPATPAVLPSSTPAEPSLGLPPTADLGPVAVPTAPVISTRPPEGTSNLQNLSRLAAARAAELDSYLARLRRREQVKGKDQPEEVILFKFRREPWSVHMRWIGTEAQGREVLYVQGQYENKLHTLLTKGDTPLAFMVGKHFALALDDPRVRDASRHPITEAGIVNLVGRFVAVVAANDKGGKQLGTLTYLGPQKRPEFTAPLEAVEQLLQPGADAGLPRGGKRFWFFDTVKERLPLLVIAQDETGREVEYYCYDYIQWPVKLDNDDFNPEKLGTRK